MQGKNQEMQSNTAPPRFRRYIPEALMPDDVLARVTGIKSKLGLGTVPECIPCITVLGEGGCQKACLINRMLRCDLLPVNFPISDQNKKCPIMIQLRCPQNHEGIRNHCEQANSQGVYSADENAEKRLKWRIDVDLHIKKNDSMAWQKHDSKKYSKTFCSTIHKYGDAAADIRSLMLNTDEEFQHHRKVVVNFESPNFPDMDVLYCPGSNDEEGFLTDEVKSVVSSIDDCILDQKFSRCIAMVLTHPGSSNSLKDILKDSCLPATVKHVYHILTAGQVDDLEALLSKLNSGVLEAETSNATTVCISQYQEHDSHSENLMSVILRADIDIVTEDQIMEELNRRDTVDVGETKLGLRSLWHMLKNNCLQIAFDGQLIRRCKCAASYAIKLSKQAVGDDDVSNHDVKDENPTYAFHNCPPSTEQAKQEMGRLFIIEGTDESRQNSSFLGKFQPLVDAWSRHIEKTVAGSVSIDIQGIIANAVSSSHRVVQDFQKAVSQAGLAKIIAGFAFQRSCKSDLETMLHGIKKAFISEAMSSILRSSEDGVIESTHVDGAMQDRYPILFRHHLHEELERCLLEGVEKEWLHTAVGISEQLTTSRVQCAGLHENQKEMVFTLRGLQDKGGVLSGTATNGLFSEGDSNSLVSTLGTQYAMFVAQKVVSILERLIIDGQTAAVNGETFDSWSFLLQSNLDQDLRDAVYGNIKHFEETLSAIKQQCNFVEEIYNSPALKPEILEYMQHVVSKALLHETSFLTRGMRARLTEQLHTNAMRCEESCSKPENLLHSASAMSADGSMVALSVGHDTDSRGVEIWSLITFKRLCRLHASATYNVLAIHLHEDELSKQMLVILANANTEVFAPFAVFDSGPFTIERGHPTGIQCVGVVENTQYDIPEHSPLFAGYSLLTGSEDGTVQSVPLRNVLSQSKTNKNSSSSVPFGSWKHSHMLRGIGSCRIGGAGDLGSSQGRKGVATLCIGNDGSVIICFNDASIAKSIPSQEGSAWRFAVFEEEGDESAICAACISGSGKVLVHRIIPQADSWSVTTHTIGYQPLNNSSFAVIAVARSNVGKTFIVTAGRHDSSTVNVWSWPLLTNPDREHSPVFTLKLNIAPIFVKAHFKKAHNRLVIVVGPDDGKLEYYEVDVE